MKILALEFSSAQRSIALVRQTNAPDAVQEYEVVETGNPASRSFEMIEEVLRQAGAEREQVECLAIGLGPGSYTGIRGAIALAQGWQLGMGTPLQGLSSAECIALQARAEGLSGRIAVVVDAQRGEFYVASYELATHECREREPLRLASAEIVTECERRGEQLVGPEVLKWFPNGRTVFPRAATLAKLALRQNRFTPGEQLEPIYLRVPTFVKAPPPRILPD